MKTVKEIATITGVSARTLHYYDEIGLLVPTEKSEAGYRLYDEKALERLQQILFFRELDIPLKEIKEIMDKPSYDTNQVLKMQRKMIEEKKEHLEQLLITIDQIIKGENKMDFSVFTKVEIENMFQLMFDSMPEEIRQASIKSFGSVEQWRKHYIEVVSSEKMQKGYAKIMEWYGGKEAYLETLKHPASKDQIEDYKKQEDTIRKKLIAMRDENTEPAKVNEIIREYADFMKKICQMKEDKGIMLSVAKSYREEKCSQLIDKQYGEGAAEYFAQMIEAYYLNS